MNIKPIGKVVKLPRKECLLEIDPAYKEGLQGIKTGGLSVPRTPSSAGRRGR